MRTGSRILLIALLLSGVLLSLADRAYSMAQVTLQNKTNFELNLFIDGNFGCGPVLPGLFCSTNVTPGSHFLEARKGTDPSQIIDHKDINISDGFSQVWTVNYQEEFDRQRAEKAVMQYYRIRGEWAGIFRMDSIHQLIPEKLGDRSYRLKVEYHYTPIPANRLHRTDTGIDRRVFSMEVFGGNYIITGMGDHMSW